MALYLGLDLSTQSISALVIEVDPIDSGDRDGARRVVADVSLPFDEILPSYGTRSGVLPSDDPTVAHSSPRMWVEALDAIMARLVDDGVDLAAVRAVAGSGQQHGSVYLRRKAGAALESLLPSVPLIEQLDGVFSRATSPIWMDSSTAEECAEITDSLGGPREVAALTGSRAFERFTGPQIRKFYKTEPEAYTDTATIHLVSSFMASLLAGKHAPIDPGDGAGMNLMDLARRSWSGLALGATAPGLKSKLPPIAPSSTDVGPVSRYFVQRYGLAESARAIAWSGDNPCSLIGVGIVEAGQVAISLGTSDTLFGFMPEARVDPAGDGHVFGAPTGHFMSLICFKNGSLAREKVRDRFGLDWESFGRALDETPAGNDGGVMLPWFDPEITPTVLEAGAKYYGLEQSSPARVVRAVVEGQMASIVLHSRWMGVRTSKIYATGGASRSRPILQVMADVHGAEVYPFSVGNSAALGAALRAWHADFGGAEWPDVVRGFAEPLSEERVLPRKEHRAVYDRFLSLYETCEAHGLGRGDDPTGSIRDFGTAR